MTVANGEQMVKAVGEIFPHFLEKMISFCFGQIYARPNLDLKIRVVVTITALITQGAFEQLDFRIKASLEIIFNTNLVSKIFNCKS